MPGRECENMGRLQTRISIPQGEEGSKEEQEDGDDHIDLDSQDTTGQAVAGGADEALVLDGVAEVAHSAGEEGGSKASLRPLTSNQQGKLRATRKPSCPWGG